MDIIDFELRGEFIPLDAPEPVLAFEAEDMRERLARLKERGHPLSDEMPDTLDDALNAVLVAPEGTRLLFQF